MTTTTTTSNDFALDQIAPLVLVFVVPLLVLYGRNYLSEFAFNMITVASSALPWNWSSIYEHGSIIAKPKKKPTVRTRAEQLAARTDDRPGASPIKQHRIFRLYGNNHFQKLPMMHRKWKRVYSTPASSIFPGHIASRTPQCRCAPPSTPVLLRASGHLIMLPRVLCRHSPPYHTYNRT